MSVAMPEENLETRELKEQLDELRERAEEGDPRAAWTLQLSLSTAIIAVFAAISSLQSGGAESAALLAKNESILAQAKASDQWGYFQAKTIKAALYEVQLETTTNSETLTKFRAKKDTYDRERSEVEKEARAFESEVERSGKQSEEAFHRHHRFALAVTAFQVSIALAAIAALTRRKPLWWTSLAIGGAGFLFFAKGFGFFGG